jgi:hypothetical protein
MRWVFSGDVSDFANSPSHSSNMTAGFVGHVAAVTADHSSGSLHAASSKHLPIVWDRTVRFL